MKIKAFASFVTFVLASLFPALAKAAIVTFSFDAVVSSISERNQVTDEWKFGLTTTSVPGSLVAIGDNIYGSFFYDTETPSSPYYFPPATTIGSSQSYYGPTIGMAFSSPDSDLSYHFPGPQQSLSPSLSVDANFAPYGGASVFHLNTFLYNPEKSEGGYITLYDPSGTAFQSSEIPIDLNINNFQFANLYYGVITPTTELVLNAQFTTLIRTSSAQIPEPTTIALFGLGLFGFGASRRRLVKSCAHNSQW